MEYLTLLILSYITLLFLSFLFNKRLSKTGKILHRCLYYIPCVFLLFVYLAIFLVMYSLNAFWKSRIFFRPMKMVNCPIGEENRISTLLSPLDLLFQVSDEYFVSVDAMCVLKGEFSIAKFKDSLLRDFAFAKDAKGRLLYPKLTQVVKERSLYSTWEYYPDFNIDDHVVEKWVDLSVEADVRQFLSEMNQKRIPSHQPGFQFFVLHDKHTTQYTEDSMTYVVYRLDHTLGDGLTFVRIFTNSLGKPLTEEDKPKLEALFRKFDSSPRINSFRNLLFLALLSPLYLADMLELEPANFFNRKNRNIRRKYLAYSPPLDFKKVSTIKRRTSTSVNDVFLMLLGQAIQSYLLEKGEKPDSAKFVSFYQAISFNTQLNSDSDHMSNNAMTIRIKLPVHTLDWRKQLNEIHSAMLEIKLSLVPVFNLFMAIGISFIPKYVRNVTQKMVLRTFSTGTLANVPGPDVKLTLAGVPIDRMAVFMPLPAGLTLGSVFLTYGDQLSVSISVDGSICAEPEVIIEHFIKRLDDIYQAVSSNEDLK